MSAKLTADLRAAIATAESAGLELPTAGNAFTERAAAIEFLEVHVVDRLQHAAAEEPLSEVLQALAIRATELQQQLENANARFTRRLAARIRAGRYTRAGLLRSFVRCAGPTSDARDRDYDALDMLIASLLDAGALPEERAVREHEMVAYQPTPARAILELIEAADLRPSDVLVDLGSGLGWVVVVVALLSEATAVGIEFEPTYCEYARSCARALGAVRATFVHADAREASLETGTVFFLYTPFRGEMLQQVLARLHAEASRRAIRVCTYGPCTAEIATLNWLRLRASHSLAEHKVAVFDSIR